MAGGPVRLEVECCAPLWCASVCGDGSGGGDGWQLAGWVGMVRCCEGIITYPTVL